MPRIWRDLGIVTMTRVGEFDRERRLMRAGRSLRTMTRDDSNDEDGGKPFVEPERQELALQCEARERIEVAQRLVEQELRAVVDECACKRCALRHSARSYEDRRWRKPSIRGA